MRRQALGDDATGLVLRICTGGTLTNQANLSDGFRQYQSHSIPKCHPKHSGQPAVCLIAEGGNSRSVSANVTNSCFDCEVTVSYVVSFAYEFVELQEELRSRTIATRNRSEYIWDSPELI